MNHQQTAAALHAEFCQLTGFQVRLNYIRESTWSEFISSGFTADDLRLVVRWIKAQMGKPNSGYSPRSLMFNNFFSDGLTKFEDRLELARRELGRRTRPASAPVAKTTPMPGGSVTRLDTAPPELNDKDAAELVRREMERFKTRMKGGAPQ